MKSNNKQPSVPEVKTFSERDDSIEKTEFEVSELKINIKWDHTDTKMKNGEKTLNY